MESWKQAAKFGSSQAHFHLGFEYDVEGGSLASGKKGHLKPRLCRTPWARYDIGKIDAESGTNGQDMTLEKLRLNQVNWRDHLSIGKLLNQLGIIMPCMI